MVIFSDPKALRDFLFKERKKGNRIGFVPTMGALHEGHLSLVKRGKSDCDIVVTSVFVNPTQFNESSDLENYPRDIEKDSALLEKVDCDVLFIPRVEDMYSDGSVTAKNYDYGLLTEVMEAEKRPGHFDGVITIVRKFLQLIEPDCAFFGQKDYQQLAVVRHMVRVENLPTTIVGCEIMREEDGVAMSSRNTRLNAEERVAAKLLSKILYKIPDLKKTMTLEEAQEWVQNQFDNEPLVKLEYFCLADAQTLKPCESWRDAFETVCCIAAFVGEIRLIDNLIIKA